MAETWLVTGGCGFIGSNFVKRVLGRRPDVRLVNYDLLTYAGNPENLQSVECDARYGFVKGDVADAAAVASVFGRGVDRVVHFAAESHVDRSILDSTPFLRTNVLGTQILLDAARKAGVKMFLQVSTDEVYGSLGPGVRSRETDLLLPNSPYAASKASAELLVRAAHRTFGLPAVVSRCSNNYGPYQFPEKLIPLFIVNASENKPLPVYGDGLYVRDWIHVDDHADALLKILEEGRPGETYNVAGENERPNIEITRSILRILGKPESLITHVKDRPGHDRRYAVDAGKLASELGFRPAVGFDEGLRRTVEWYMSNRTWWERVRTGEYLSYYESQYGARMRACK